MVPKTKEDQKSGCAVSALPNVFFLLLITSDGYIPGSEYENSGVSKLQRKTQSYGSNEFTWTSLYTENGELLWDHSYYIKTANMVFEFLLMDPEEKDIFNQILPTFEFIE